MTNTTAATLIPITSGLFLATNPLALAMRQERAIQDLVIDVRSKQNSIIILSVFLLYEPTYIG